VGQGTYENFTYSAHRHDHLSESDRRWTQEVELPSLLTGFNMISISSNYDIEDGVIRISQKFGLKGIIAFGCKVNQTHIVIANKDDVASNASLIFHAELSRSRAKRGEFRRDRSLDFSQFEWLCTIRE
jgi:hypothetical protein